ncbi:MAG: PAS domain-containing protein [Candidatus Cloacimonetes bacterium]|nr:PAS domain-containing protein [Candidatus Cloacimonadota bacterium]MCF7813533.1 PAS domain-containing protein [Candidatus Cloacimonadota bacterium]MCF7868683.1 PAS domain-containing protein [Candidatus Cloacimonadota bacterium]MCF7884187.1 PAS domain-containing protein [Candidatus Cloacimonadota bacterium]
MKNTFTGKIRFLVILLFLITITQTGIIFQLMDSSVDIADLKMNIQNTLFITVFLQFMIVIIIIFYIPVFLHKAFSEIHNILKDISQGIYNIDIDLDVYNRSMDKEFLAVLDSINEMLKSVLTFDKLKKDKIVEHHNRILAILNLTDDGFMALDVKGNIVYINDIVTKTFPSISENQNMIESNFPPEVENNIKKYILHILKSKTKQQPQQFFMPSMKKHISLNSAVIRDANGQMAGVVVSFTNLGMKKKEEKE